jgi:hypothetical protein
MLADFFHAGCLTAGITRLASEPASLLIVLVEMYSQYHKELTVRHPRIIIASISLAAAATTSHANSQPAAGQPSAATVRTVQATVSAVQLAWRSVPSVRWGRAGGMLLRNPGE